MMKKNILLFCIVILVSPSFAQVVSSKTDSDITVDDALYFLNKKYKDEIGKKSMEISFQGRELRTSVTEWLSNIDSINITEDSIMVISYSYISHTKSNVGLKPKDETRKNNYSFKIKLSTASLVTFKTIEKPAEKIEDFAGAKQTIKYLIFNEDTYTIGNIDIASYLSLEKRSRADFNELASRIANAFNFIIKAYGGGKTSNELQRDEKF